MGLNWSVSGVKNYKELYDEKKILNVITNTLITATIPVGMDEITEKNHEEFYTRLKMWENAHGTFMNDITDEGKKPHPFTLEYIRRHIGLRTNATLKTVTQFHKSVTVSMRRWAEMEIRSEKSKLDHDTEEADS